MIPAFSFITLKIITSTLHFHSVEFPFQCRPTPFVLFGYTNNTQICLACCLPYLLDSMLFW